MILKQPTTVKNRDTNRLFPVFLKAENLQVLIIGGGTDAFDKLHVILQNAPATEITLIAPSISKEIEAFSANNPNITLEERSYESDVLDEGDVIIIAVNNHHLSKKIYSEAKERGKLVNVSDMPELCDFYFSSIVHKGNLKLAISTNGKSPAIAKRLNETLDKALPDEMDEILQNMQIIGNRLNGNFKDKVTRLHDITRVLVAENVKARKWKKLATWCLVVFGSMLFGHFVFSYLPLADIGISIVSGYRQLDGNFPLLVLAGFVAQLVDGALGMGYGLTSTTILLSAGVNAAAISGSVHTAEMFASGASGYSHYKFGNVNKKMFKKLVIPGALGAIAGAVLLVNFGDSEAKYIRPLLATYTMILGIKFIFNAFKPRKVTKKFKQYSVLAGAGGFLDSFGGGGWGPIVTSTLINVGRSPKYVIGTVSLTEFFVTLASAFSFFVMIGVTHWQVILGLIIGGLAAAPIAAKLAGKMPRKTAYLLLGILVIIWSLRIIIKSF